MQVKTAENRDMCDWVQSVLVFSQAPKRTVISRACVFLLIGQVTYH